MPDQDALGVLALRLHHARRDPRRAGGDDRVGRGGVVHVGEKLDLELGPLGGVFLHEVGSLSAFFMSEVKLRRSRVAPGERPMASSSPHASSTYLRRLASAFGAGSVATTSNPRARYWAAQLAPMTPVPTMAIR